MDPFACFDDDDEDDEEEDTQYPENFDDDNNDNKNENVVNSQKRNPANGVMAFHNGTEEALLLYVERYLMEDNNIDDTSQLVLNAVDRFCCERHWMMHVGDVKGEILTNTLKCTLKSFSQGSSGTQQQQKRFIAVELGTYCGYSSVLIGKHLRDYYNNSSSTLVNNEDGAYCRPHLYSLEVDPGHARRSNKLIQLAGLEQFVSIIQFSPYDDNKSCEDVVGDLLLRKKEDDKDSPQQQQHANFVFVDHDKDLYLSDLKMFERRGFIDRGSVVVADNVLWAFIDNYLEYVRKRHEDGIVRTKTIECPVEYSEQEVKEKGFETLKDGMEITTYLCDPRS